MLDGRHLHLCRRSFKRQRLSGHYSDQSARASHHRERSKAFIEVNAQKTRLFNVSTRVPLEGGSFGSYVQVDDDEAFLLDGLDTSLGGGAGTACAAMPPVCDPVIYAPGPFRTFPGVGWLKNLNISLQCGGNGIDWQAGNTLRISDSVIQGYAQYGVRAGTQRGGYGGFDLTNVYQEVGNCANPLGKIGQAGVIAQGGSVKIQGGEAPTGSVPLFAQTGKTDYRYYIVARHARHGASNPLYAGKALTNGTGSIVVTTPTSAGAASFDLLRVTPVAGAREQAPYGDGKLCRADERFPQLSLLKGSVHFHRHPGGAAALQGSGPDLLSPARLLAGKSGVGRESGFQQRSGGRPGLDGSCSLQRGRGARDHRTRADLHQLRFACGLDAAVGELLLSHGSVGVLRAGSIPAGGKAQRGRRSADEPQRPDEFFHAGNRARTHHHALRFQFPEDHRHRKQPAEQ